MSKSIEQELLNFELLDEKVYDNNKVNNNSIRVIVCKLNKQLNGFRFITWISKDKKSTYIKLIKNEAIK